MRIAMVSEHASPLATLGGVDAGGQNVHVAALATELSRMGHEVDVYTRRDDPSAPPSVELRPGVTVHHVDAGPAEPLPKDELLPFMPAFGKVLLEAWADRRPDAVHAHFWMSGLAALDACRPLELPLAVTFHALGVVKRRHQGCRDTSPARLDSAPFQSTARTAYLTVGALAGVSVTFDADFQDGPASPGLLSGLTVPQACRPVRRAVLFSSRVTARGHSFPERSR